MEIRAVRLLANVLLPTCMHFVINRMVLLFFPAMGILAPIFLLAPISICLDEVLGFPLLALVFLILIDMRLSPEVLPIVGIDALVSRVRGIRVGAPNSFEMKHVKICIFLEFTKQVNRHFIF